MSARDEIGSKHVRFFCLLDTCVVCTNSGDGAGMMTSIPWELFKDMVSGDDIKKSGIGMFFLPQVMAG